MKIADFLSRRPKCPKTTEADTTSAAKEKLMKLFNAAKTVCMTAMIGAALTSGVRADELNRKTVVTFSGPVEIPGVHLAGWGVLPAGTYVFKILDSASD